MSSKIHYASAKAEGSRAVGIALPVLANMSFNVNGGALFDPSPLCYVCRTSCLIYVIEGKVSEKFAESDTKL